jgi:hypothetical protein
VPWFIDNRQLRMAVWLITEAVTRPIIERLDQLMTLVTVDSDALAAVGTAVNSLETEFEAFVAANPAIPAGSLDGINASLADFKTKLDAASTPVTGGGPTGGSTGATGATGATAAPGDPTSGTGTPPAS